MNPGGHSPATRRESGASLLPLTPSYEESEHAGYLRYLREALDGPQSRLVRNIAVTGGYGVGKSSVLRKLRDDLSDRAVGISLATLGDAPPLDDLAASADAASREVTNRIQKEIVKQLLYRERPERVPGSRYRRISAFRWPRAIASSLVAAAVLVVVLYLTRSADRLVRLAGHGLLPHAVAYLGLLVAAGGAIAYWQRAFHNRLRIQQLGAGSASITLSASADTYFDEYLDEIVYFFEATSADVVVFEDIDRFDDPHIFEALRELNTILNNSRQLRDKRVRFIYAIKDSIFEQLGSPAAGEDGATADAAEAQVARANRTKFFDLVIPVVPFVTHRSARDLMSQTLAMAGLPVSQELVTLAARHVADMRLIKNIRNEFAVFREKLISGEGCLPGLGDDQLFAMILYKNVHLADFELIRTGQSRLDVLYRHSRALVSQNIRDLDQLARRLEEGITDPEPTESRCDRLGERLERYLRAFGRSRRPHGGHFAMQMGGQPVAPQELRSVAFWRSLAEPGAELRLVISPYNEAFSLTSDVLGEVLDEDLSVGTWEEHRKEALRTSLAAVVHDKLILAHASLKALHEQPRFKVKIGEADRSFAAVTQETLGSELARSLVAGGYIDANFTLYVSQFHGVHVSSQAMNFIVHCVQPNVMDAYFQLGSPGDVEAVLRESGPSVPSERSMYNIAILDYLLRRQDAGADVIIRRLKARGPDEQEFLRAYVAGGKEVTAMIGRLSGLWPQTLPLVVEDLDVSDERRATLFNAAMVSADPLDLPDPGGPVRAYIEDRYLDLPSLTGDIGPAVARQVVELLRHFGVTLRAIQPLGAHVREGVIEHRLWAFSGPNLITATGGGSLALDRIQKASEHAYAHVLDNLSGYAQLVTAEPSAVTVESPARFAAVLEDVADHDQASVAPVALHAGPGCEVGDLSAIRGATWPALARARRFPATFANVTAYAGEIGIDEDLAVILLAEPKIRDHEAAPDGDREALAVSILNAGAALPDPAVRVQIAAGLDLPGPIGISMITPEPGELAGMLVAGGIVADNADAYDAVASLDWQTREHLISCSASFPDYATARQMPSADLPRLITSRVIKDATKEALLGRLPELAPEASRSDLEPVASYAARRKLRLGSGALLLLAEAGIPGRTIVVLLHSVLPEISPDDLAAILVAAGEPYELLTRPGRRRATLPHDHPHRALADQLTREGHVNSYTIENDGANIRVNMKHR